MSQTFIERFEVLQSVKNSIICIGLDPAVPEQRTKNVIPENYSRDAENSELRLNFCLDILEKTADFCVAAKPNEQYVRGFTSKQHQELTSAIRNHNLVSIYDCKLGDIRDTAESALFYYHKWGYDGITFNPFPGNIAEVVRIAHDYTPQIGIIVLTLMSNPEAETFMRYAKVGRQAVYLKIADDVKKFGADGCVVGATGHVTGDDIKKIRRRAGKDKVFLVPGIGAQKGDPEKVIKYGGNNILINIGRDIIYSDAPRKKVQEYFEIFNKIRREHQHTR
jgi:orotidine-5'-phosphate decarboxylase